MTPSIIPADSLDRVVGLVTTRSAGTEGGLSEADRRLIEVVLGSACHGPAARDEYLAALARSAGGRPGESAAGPYESAAWDALLRDGPPGLSDARLLAVAASADAVRELNRRVGGALRDGTLAEVWWSYYDAFPDPPDPVIDERFRETVEVFRRLHAERTEWSRKAEAPRPTGVAASARIQLTREFPPLNMAAADDAEAVRFLGADGPVLEVHPSHRPGLSELCLVAPLSDAAVELLLDGIPIRLVAPFDRDGLATAQTADVTPAIHGRARLELRFRPAADSSDGGPIPNPPCEGRP